MISAARVRFTGASRPATVLHAYIYIYITARRRSDSASRVLRVQHSGVSPPDRRLVHLNLTCACTGRKQCQGRRGQPCTFQPDLFFPESSAWDVSGSTQSFDVYFGGVAAGIHRPLRQIGWIHTEDLEPNALCCVGAQFPAFSLPDQNLDTVHVMGSPLPSEPLRTNAHLTQGYTGRDACRSLSRFSPNLN